MDLKNRFSVENSDLSTKYVIFLLTLIGLIGIILRLNYLPLDIPFLSDALLYFSYANDLNFLNQFPNGYNFTNNGWPTLIGIIFNFFPSTEIIQLMNFQRITSIIISTITIIPVYYLCRKFFPNYLAIIGACIFIFEPRIIINSLLGITDPLYIFLITSSLSLFLSKNRNYIFISFACIAFSILVRYEGMIWFCILTVIFFIYNKKEFNYKIILKYVIIIFICISIIAPMLEIRNNTMGSDQISTVLYDSVDDVRISSNSENGVTSFILYLINGLINLFKYLAWIMVPFLGIFVPIGMILAIKNKDQKSKFLIFGLIIVLATSTLYAYSRGIQDTRYLYPLYPIFAVFSLFIIQKILEKTNKKIIISSIIISIILISSIIYLEIKSIDIEHEKEAFEIFKEVHPLVTGINKINYESGYITVISLLEQNQPILISNFDQNIKYISYDKNLQLKEFLKNNSNNGLSHIVIDNGKDRPDFFQQLMNNEKIEYLEEVYDSKKNGFNYHIKLFKIDFSKLD